MAFLDKEGLIRTVEHIKTYVANELGKLTKADFGLSNVDNTSDADKPISTLQQNALNNKVDKISGKGLSTNDFTTDEKNKLSFISSGAEVNQNAYSNVIVNSTTLSAKTETDSLQLVAGSNVTLTPDSSTNKITISSTGGGNENDLSSSVYSNRFLQMIANGEKLYVVSNNINDTVYSGGRGFKRNSSEKIIIGRFGAEYWGHYIMGTTQESLAYVNATEYGELNNIGSFVTPLGNTVYIATMKSAWKPSTSNYVIATINGIQHVIKERTFTSSNDLTTDISKWILGIADVELFNDQTLQPLDSNHTISDKIFNNLTNTGTKTNLLDVDLKTPNADKNKIHRIGTGDASTLSNSPITSGNFYADWECRFHTISGSNSRLIVKITEYFPVNGRIWYNHYNWTAWTGWRNDYNPLIYSSSEPSTNLYSNMIWIQ